MERAKDSDPIPVVLAVSPEIPLEELEERLEMQHVAADDPSMLCYTDLCTELCSDHCTAGYTGCPDLCGCQGHKCGLECGALCTVDSCVVDI